MIGPRLTGSPCRRRRHRRPGGDDHLLSADHFGVNVTSAGDTVPSAVLLDWMAIVTAAVGCVFSTTVNVAVPPASVVLSSLSHRTVTPAASLSVFVTETSGSIAALVVAACYRADADRVGNVAVVHQIVHSR